MTHKDKKLRQPTLGDGININTLHKQKENNLSNILTGGCSCGAILYECTGEAITSFNCHCRACQHYTGSGYIAGTLFPIATFKITKGAVREYQSTGENGIEIYRGFCENCGSPMQTIKITYNIDVNKSFQFLSLVLAIIVLIGIGKISGEAFDLEGGGILGLIIIAIATTIIYQVIKLIRNIKTAISQIYSPRVG
jgi:hypothetical protein